jgi:DNA polymerase-3 subunit alpha
MPRPTLAENMERAVEYAQNKKEDKQFGQVSLFEDTGEKEYPDFEFKELPEWNRMEKLRIENELMGFYFSGHPMDDYKAAWEHNVTLNLAYSDTAKSGNYILVGIIKAIKPYTTKKGTEMAFTTLLDYNGEMEVTFFPEVWEKEQTKIMVDKVVALKGKIDHPQNRDNPSFLVESLLDVDKLQQEAIQKGPKKPVEKAGSESKPRKTVTEKPKIKGNQQKTSGSETAKTNKAEAIFKEVHIRLNESAAEQEETLYPLRDMLIEASGTCSVFIHVPITGGETVIRTSSQMSVTADATSIDTITHCTGVETVWCE